MALLSNISAKPARIPKTSPSSAPKLIKSNKKIIKNQQKVEKPLNKTQLYSLSPAADSFKGPTPIIALDCEMVLGVDDLKHIARISLVNYNRQVLLDTFVRPAVEVKNYLTEVTNITHHQLRGTRPLPELLPVVRELLAGRTLVGHSLQNDLQLLGAEVEVRRVRDVSLFRGYRNGKYRQGLKALALAFLGLNVQSGAHSSVEDARAALELYKLNAAAIDRDFRDTQLQQLRAAVLPATP